MAHLITGYKGSEHIKSADQGSFNAAFFGAGQFVMEIGNQFEGSIINNNTVRILDGDLLMYGRHVRIEPNTYEDLTVDTGTAGMNRIDLVCMVYEKNSSDGTEKAYLQVVKGTETEGTAGEPAYVDGNILSGATRNQMPLYRLQIEGVVLKSITQMFKTIPTYKTLAEQYAVQFEKACNTYLGALNILDTMEEVNANTKTNQLAGALALKEVIKSVASNFLKTSGGTVNGVLKVGNKVSIWTDNGGGIISLFSASGVEYRFDTYNGNGRVQWTDSSGKTQTITIGRNGKIYIPNFSTDLGGYITQFIEANKKQVSSVSDNNLYNVTSLCTFRDTNNALISGSKGNYIFGISAFSDKRLKTNVHDSDVCALEKVNQIRYRSFDFKDEQYGNHEDIGYIADELKEIFPECVVSVPQDRTTCGYDELYQVEDKALVKYLGKAIQELTDIVNTQQKEIDLLKSK